MIFSRSPGGLHGGAEGRSLARGEADGRNTENIGAELAPEGALGATAGDPDLGRLDAQGPEALQTVSEAQGDSLHGSPGEVCGGEVLHGDAVENATATREIRCALPGKVGEEQESVAPSRNGRRRLRVPVVAPALEQRSGEFRDERDIHRAGERHPRSGAVAEGGHLALRINDGRGTEGVERAGGAEARGHDAGTDVAGADGPHHVVPAARADRDRGGEVPLGAEFFAELAGGFGGVAERRKLLAESWRNRVEDGLGPGPGLHVEECRAGGVSVLHRFHSCEPPVDVIVGKEHGGRFRPVLGFVLADPEDFGGRVTGEHGVAGEFHDPGLAAERAGQFGALRGRRGITPELGGPDDGVGRIQEDESVLLAADADAGDLGAAVAQLFENLGDGSLHGGDPDGGILLHGAFSLRLNEAIGLLGAGEDLSRLEIKGDGLCALGSAVDAEGDHGTESMKDV